MTKKQKKIQIGLVLTGLILIFITYFYYPYANKMKSSENKRAEKELEKTEKSDQATFFENVKYSGLSYTKPFTIEAEKAYMLNENPDLIYMSKMSCVLYLDNNRTVTVTSDAGKYNKLTFDIFFEKNVIGNDGKIKILAENLDLLASEQSAKIYNEVSLSFPEGSLDADSIDYNFETKYFKVTMFNNEMIKMKVIK